MRIQKLIWAGFAIAALASATLPALAWTALPDLEIAAAADYASR